MSQAGSISSNGGGTTATDFVADTGMAQPSGGEIDLLGGTLITTSAAGNIVTFSADDEVVGSIVTDSGTCTPTGNSFNLLGGDGITTSASGASVTVTLDNPVTVALGGSGRATATAYAVICGGTTATGAHQSIASVGTSGQVLTSNGAGALPTFEDASGGSTPAQTLYWKASDFDVLETNFAPLVQDNGSNNRVMVRGYDDTTEEFVNFTFPVPGEINTSGTVTFRAFVYAATAVASRFVQLSFNHVPITSNESWDAAGTDENSGDIALSGTQDQITAAAWTETVSNLGWAADDLVVCRLSRIAPTGTNLSGDLYLIGFEIEIPRS